MIITDPRGTLRALLDAAIASAQPALSVPPNLPSPPDGRTVVVGFGKAAAAMARAVEDHYPAPLEGVVVCPHGAAKGHGCRSIRVIEAGHPVADIASMVAARAILAAVSGLTQRDLVIVLISGGGSALMELPRSAVNLSEMQALVMQLMHGGAPIGEINAVRGALSQVKGGGLAAAIYPARCVALTISDVVGDDIRTIASGPTSVPAAASRAREVLNAHGIAISQAVQSALEEADCCNRPSFDHVENCLIATPMMALQAAAESARQLGLTPRILSDGIEGSPADAARLHLRHARELRSGDVLLSGGELTSCVSGTGRGGPNLEFCLELIEGLQTDGGCWAIACDTDGRDGNSGVAGAIVGPDSMIEAASRGIDLTEYRSNSDSHGLFAALDALVDTGWTGTNVNDFRANVRL